jgi:hypothetical protein
METRGDGERSTVQVIGADEPHDTTGVGRRRSHLMVILLFVVSLAGLITIIGVGGGGETPGQTGPPRLLSEPEPVTIDVRTDQTTTNNRWRLADLEAGTRLSNVVATDAGFAAVGVDTDGPGIWTSWDGSRWELMHRLEQPPDAQAVMRPTVGSQPLLFARWHDSLLTIAWVDGEGTAIWMDADFVGYVTGLDSRFASTAVPGAELIAAVMPVGLSPGEGADQDQPLLVVTENGIDWTEVPAVGLPDDQVPYLAGFAGGYFYISTTCQTQDCSPPGIYRSADEFDWQPAVLESADAERVFFASVADVGDRLLGVGAVVGPGSQQPAIWSSDDGEFWSLDDLDYSLQPESTTIELIAVDPDTRNSATVAVDGQPFELTEDSEIETDVGSITVANVNSDSVRLTIGTGRSQLVDIHEQVSIDRFAFLQEVSGRGERVAIRGFRFARSTGDASAIASAIWLSQDGGTTWTAETLGPGTGAWTRSMAVSDSGIVVVGSSADGARSHVWYYDPADD